MRIGRIEAVWMGVIVICGGAAGARISNPWHSDRDPSFDRSHAMNSTISATPPSYGVAQPEQTDAIKAAQHQTIDGLTVYKTMAGRR